MFDQYLQPDTKARTSVINSVASRINVTPLPKAKSANIGFPVSGVMVFRVFTTLTEGVPGLVKEDMSTHFFWRIPIVATLAIDVRVGEVRKRQHHSRPAQ